MHADDFAKTLLVTTFILVVGIVGISVLKNAGLIRIVPNNDCKIIVK